MRQRGGEVDGTCLGGCVGRVATGGAFATDRRDGDQRPLASRQRVSKLLGAGHQAVEVDVDDAAEGVDLKLLAAIGYRALAQHQHVQRCGRRGGGDGRKIGHVDLVVVQFFQVGAFIGAVVRRSGACTPHMDLRPVAAKCLRDAVADAAGAAHYQNGLAAEVERIGDGCRVHVRPGRPD